MSEELPPALQDMPEQVAAITHHSRVCAPRGASRREQADWPPFSDPRPYGKSERTALALCTCTRDKSLLEFEMASGSDRSIFAVSSFSGEEKHCQASGNDAAEAATNSSVDSLVDMLAGLGDKDLLDKLQTARVTVQACKSAKQRGTSAVRRGFFEKKKPAARCNFSKEQTDSDISLQKGVKQTPVPEDFYIQPSPTEAYRAAAFEALKPSQGNLQAVLQDKELLQGFDDPEVMAAVNEVARHPDNASKYMENPKVQNFYRRMGRLMQKRLADSGAN